MKIQCTIPRDRNVELWGEVYQFRQDDKGRFVAEVEDEAHIERLLEIDCYRKVVSTASAAAPTGLGLNPPIETTSRPASTTPITPPEVADAPEAPVIEPNSDGSDDNGEGTDEDADKPAEVKLTPEQELAAARAEYEAHFGKKPHHSQKAARLRELIAEDKEDNA